MAKKNVAPKIRIEKFDGVIPNRFGINNKQHVKWRRKTHGQQANSARLAFFFHRHLIREEKKAETAKPLPVKIKVTGSALLLMLDC